MKRLFPVLLAIIAVQAPLLASEAAQAGESQRLFPGTLCMQWGDEWGGGGGEPYSPRSEFGGGRNNMFAVLVRGGLAIANYWGEDWEDLLGDDTEDPYKLGGSGEVSFAYNPIKYVSIQLGWAYVMKGTWLDWESPTSEFEYQTLFHYFEFPLLVVARIPTGSVVTPRIFAGMSFGFFLGGTWEWENRSKVTGTTTSSDDDLEDVESFDFGFIFGAGMEIRINATAFFFFDVRYNFSITEFDDDSGTSWDDVQHEYICISIGVGFTFG